MYGALNLQWKNVSSPEGEKQVTQYLANIWSSTYRKNTKGLEIYLMETVLDGVYYLFDVEQQRLVTASCISKGKNSHKRETSRMKGHPLSDGKDYHRGHAIPHSMGGGTGINLVPQRAALNIGPFRVLENRAVKTPGSLYFTHWKYEGDTQTPFAVQQGLLCPGHDADIREFSNE